MNPLRSLLFIPGNSPAMLINADVHRADAIILDLEDAVAPDQKDAARVLVRNALRALGYPGVTVVVRINPLNTPDCALDIAAVAPLSPAFIMPTKVSGAEDVKAVAALLDAAERESGHQTGQISLLPLIETAQGVENAYEIASAPRVAGILLGAEDYSGDIRAIRSKEGGEIAYARGRIVNAARAGGVAAFDTPFTDVNDSGGLAADARLARSLGFTGKAAISPRHVHDINLAFSPTPEEIKHAIQILEAVEQGRLLGRGAVALRGKMIDKPIETRARQVLDMARALGLEGEA